MSEPNELAEAIGIQVRGDQACQNCGHIRDAHLVDQSHRWTPEDPDPHFRCAGEAVLINAHPDSGRVYQFAYSCEQECTEFVLAPGS